ncbi:2OG-Fe(II) oxygenase [Acuticoccus sp. I52.16.1]|uniref:2OG-Fe(II) oxygenase n=1 Tax=Acuticoccus sp. I52.16.1 TaxID=2928472 RepID=UPI001FD1E3B1|nr:2OG-Fe(II) oxygenase [Acuticoccus sp. I52.16.1]UOM36346.1 2OG-Fe(II) oxygenase [Acuticoccus sp. I52.16.1]
MATEGKPAADVKATVDALDWAAIGAEIDAYGVARTGPLLNPATCAALAALYAQERFRSRVIMKRHGFGSGEYKYFADPLPETVATLREAVYPHAARIANGWADRLAMDRYPATLGEMLARCHAEGQEKPTPLILKYGPGDYNCLHQDLYGAVAFPLQLVVLLSDPAGFEGGELVLTEQRPRMQSRAEVVTLAQGEGALFTTSVRPRRGTKGDHRVMLRHGVSRLRSGERYTLGVIFHDAA